MSKLWVKNLMFVAIVVAGFLTTNVFVPDSPFHQISPFIASMLIALFWKGGMIGAPDGRRQGKVFPKRSTIFFYLYALMILSGNERPHRIWEVQGWREIVNVSNDIVCWFVLVAIGIQLVTWLDGRSEVRKAD